MRAGEPFEGDQSGAARRGALVLEPAPQQLELLAVAELCDRPVGLGADAIVAVAGRVLDLLVPLGAQRRQTPLVARLRKLVGAGCRLRERHEIEEAGRALGPT